MRHEKLKQNIKWNIVEKGINSTVKNKFVTRHKQKYEYIVSRKRESNCGQSSWNQVSLKIISKKFQKFVKSSIKFEREILCEKLRKISENFEIQLDYAVMSLAADSLFEQVKKLGRKKFHNSKIFKFCKIYQIRTCA